MDTKIDAQTMAKYHRSKDYPLGVMSGYQLGELCGITAPSVWSKVFHGNMTKIGLVTIQNVCDGFNCSPGDWLITRPDLLKSEGAALRRARTALRMEPEEFAAAFSKRCGFAFGPDAVEAWERGQAKVRDGIWQAIALALIEAGFSRK